MTDELLKLLNMDRSSHYGVIVVRPSMENRETDEGDEYNEGRTTYDTLKDYLYDIVPLETISSEPVGSLELEEEINCC